MARWWYGYIGGTGAVGLLVLRLVAGAAFILHGWPKIYQNGQFYQNGQLVMTTWMNDVFKEKAPPPYLQGAAAVAEFGGGIALIIGFLTPLAALGIAAVMGTAIAMVNIPHGDPFVAPSPGQSSCELAAVYLAAAIALLLVGPGTLSLDYCLFGRRRVDVGPPTPIRM